MTITLILVCTWLILWLSMIALHILSLVSKNEIIDYLLEHDTFEYLVIGQMICLVLGISFFMFNLIKFLVSGVIN